MSNVTIVGCDLHDRSMLLKYAIDKNEPQQKLCPNDVEGRFAMIDFLKGFSQKHGSDRIVFVYEASGQGYGLHDLLTDHGIECYVLSPTHLPKTAKSKKNKTDPKDAMMLLEQARGFVLAGNALPIVWTPPVALRNDRELVRARLEVAEACTRVKLKITSMLKRFSIVLPKWFTKNRTWSKRFLAWLRKTAEDLNPVVTPVLLALLERFEMLRKEQVDLERHLRHLAKTERYRYAYQALSEMVGVGLVTAMTFLTEMGDLTRFSNRRQVAAYLGLCPASYESGQQDDRKGHITRQGPGRVRKVLCQAAWVAIRCDESTHADWERIRAGSPKRGKKAAVAIMRKMAIRMWHVALSVGVSVNLVADQHPPGLLTSARAQQKGTVPFTSPSPRPLPAGG